MLCLLVQNATDSQDANSYHIARRYRQAARHCGGTQVAQGESQIELK
jgi:hypothetical protein